MSRSAVASAYSPQISAEPFLVLEENRFAHAAIERLKTASPKDSARLVYLSGPSGVGKSHLVGHFVRELRRSNPAPKIAHFTGDGFADELVCASDAESIPEFRHSYAAVDVLICEDLQGLRRRDEAQRKLIAILDDVLWKGGRVLFTSRCLPGELGSVEPRLVSRCRGGISAALRLPSRESREHLLRHFASRQHVPLSLDSVRLLGESLPVSPRELLAAVTRLDAESRMRGARIDLPFVRAWLSREAMTPTLELKDIARAVAREFGVSVKAIRSETRRQGHVVPRQCAMYLARELTKKPLAQIADYFGRKNHSTVTHACERVGSLLVDDPAMRRQILHIRQSLGTAEE